MRTISRVVAGFVGDNANLLVCACGFGLVYVGISGWSREAAQVVAGSLLMVLGAYPYVRVRKS